MKKKILISLFSCLIVISVNSQITKDNWLVGGNANFALRKQESDGFNVRRRTLELSPNIGYFFIDKFAAGVKASYYHSKDKLNDFVSTGTSILGLGPFARYYILSVDRNANLFAESAYQYTVDFRGYKAHNVTGTFGSVLFFNSSVGVEFSLNYEMFNAKNINTTNTFYIAIGLQIHLEKDDNK